MRVRSLIAVTFLALASTAVLAPSDAPAVGAGVCDKVAARWGSDGNPGTAAAPFGTTRRLVGSLSPGETGCLQAGTYMGETGGYALDVDRGGAPGAPITLRSYPGERAKLRGIVHVRGEADYVTLTRLDIEGTGEANTIKVYASGFTLSFSNVGNAYRGWSCLILGNNTGGGQAVRPVVRGNVFARCGDPAHGNQDHAIYAGNVAGGKVVDNIFVKPSAYAIQFYPNAQGMLFAHNVVDGGSPSIRGGVVFGGDAEHTSNGNLVEKNIISYARTHNVEASWEDAVGTSNVVRRNCLWAGAQGNISAQVGFTATGNVSASPRFVDREGLDYRLKPGGRCLRVVGYDTAAKLRS